MTGRYQTVVFLDGDEGRRVVDKLCGVESVLAHGVTVESVEACVEYLLQWDYDDEGPHEDVQPWGDADSTDSLEWTKYEGQDLILSWNLGLGYVSLTRLVREP